jgi:Zn-dependent oligopeptidase
LTAISTYGIIARGYLEKTLSLDDKLVKDYFQVLVVFQAILEVYQDLLGVRSLGHGSMSSNVYGIDQEKVQY